MAVEEHAAAAPASGFAVSSVRVQPAQEGQARGELVDDEDVGVVGGHGAGGEEGGGED